MSSRLDYKWHLIQYLTLISFNFFTCILYVQWFIHLVCVFYLIALQILDFNLSDKNSKHRHTQRNPTLFIYLCAALKICPNVDHTSTPLTRFPLFTPGGSQCFASGGFEIIHLIVCTVRTAQPVLAWLLIPLWSRRKCMNATQTVVRPVWTRWKSIVHTAQSEYGWWRGRWRKKKPYSCEPAMNSALARTASGFLGVFGERVWEEII